jgi:hypothetical protein
MPRVKHYRSTGARREKSTIHTHIIQRLYENSVVEATNLILAMAHQKLNVINIARCFAVVFFTPSRGKESINSQVVTSGPFSCGLQNLLARDCKKLLNHFSTCPASYEPGNWKRPEQFQP